MEASYNNQGKRTSLKRYIRGNNTQCVIIMYNPSTANNLVDDRTVSKLNKIIEFNGYNSYELVNLKVKFDGNIINNRDIIIAWGNYGYEKGLHFLSQHQDKNFKCFGININGSPKMPTRMSDNTEIIDFIIN